MGYRKFFEGLAQIVTVLTALNPGSELLESYNPERKVSGPQRKRWYNGFRKLLSYEF